MRVVRGYFFLSRVSKRSSRETIFISFFLFLFSSCFFFSFLISFVEKDLYYLENSLILWKVSSIQNYPFFELELLEKKKLNESFRR